MGVEFSFLLLCYTFLLSIGGSLQKTKTNNKLPLRSEKNCLAVIS